MVVCAWCWSVLRSIGSLCQVSHGICHGCMLEQLQEMGIPPWRHEVDEWDIGGSD